MSSQHITALSSVIAIQSGYAFKSVDYTDTGHFLIRIGNVQDGFVSLDHPKYVQLDDKTRKFELSEGDILTSLTGNIGRVARISSSDLPAALNQRVAKIVVADANRLDEDYLFYFLNSFEFRENLSSGAHGAAQQNVSPKAIGLISIPLPPLEEQQRILAVLDEAFAAIATATANAEKNLANARELFSGELRYLFSQKGSLWEWKPLGLVADARLGKMLDKRKNKGTLQPYLRNLNVRWFGFDLSDLLEMRFEESEESRYTAIKGDLLIVEGGYPGRCAIWDGDSPIHFQKALHRVRFSDPRLAKILMYMLFAQNNDGSLKQYFSGAGIQHLTGQSLAKIPVPLPPVEERDDIVKRIEALFTISEDAQRIYQSKLLLLADLKQSLLQRAFSDQLTAAKSEPLPA